MVGSWKKAAVDGEEVTIPDVPYVSQNPPSNYCVVAAIKMAADYLVPIASAADGKVPPPALSFEQLRGLTRTDPLTGTQLGRELFAGLRAAIPELDFRLTPLADLTAMEGLTRDGGIVLPLYFPVVCENPSAEIPGVGHACVYLGHTSRTVLVHNPWYGPYHRWNRQAFEGSCAQTGHLAITARTRSTQKGKGLVDLSQAGDEIRA